MKHLYRVKHQFSATKAGDGGERIFRPSEELWWDEADRLFFTVEALQKWEPLDPTQFTQSIELCQRPPKLD